MFAAILGLLGNLIPSVVNVVGTKLGVDMNSDAIKTKLIEAELEVQKIVSEGVNKQLDINMAEAQNTRRTWPTWRESLGYVCVFAVAYHFVIQQFLSFILSANGISVDLPNLEMSGLMSILSAMLGIHFVDSRYNSPPGQQPTGTKAALTTTPINTARPGRLANDPEAGGLVWRED